MNEMPEEITAYEFDNVWELGHVEGTGKFPDKPSALYVRSDICEECRRNAQLACEEVARYTVESAKLLAALKALDGGFDRYDKSAIVMQMRDVIAMMERKR